MLPCRSFMSMTDGRVPFAGTVSSRPASCAAVCGRKILARAPCTWYCTPQEDSREAISSANAQNR
ncbi:hypothetical protein IR083_01160 [Dysgonomonas sp. GY75]|uniref:hypothetical protein n=1 Tax=Dysgonomonas sp. GY75 TaxID=2780419 RepID=UPI0018835E38|nr:hypothetical protein [Dysgonomonas sp. GY75]MBF0647425.1 hypothetical protein [Dysgonomonas sp. GY75]